MCAVGHGARLVLEEPGHAALPVAPALGVVAVEVPQIQFLDDEVWSIGGLGIWFDNGHMVCVSSWVLLDGFSTFSACSDAGHMWQLDPSFTGPLNLAVPCSLLWCTLQDAMLGSTVDTCYASAPGAFGS